MTVINPGRDDRRKIGGGKMWMEGGVSENMGSPRGKRQGGRGK